MSERETTTPVRAARWWVAADGRARCARDEPDPGEAGWRRARVGEAHGPCEVCELGARLLREGSVPW